HASSAGGRRPAEQHSDVVNASTPSAQQKQYAPASSGTQSVSPRVCSESDGESTDQPSAKQRLEDAMRELDALIGLESVKDRVRSLSNFLNLQRERRAAGLATMPISLHMSFVGNPGTGKTTVARIVGQVMGAMGVLKSGHLVETDRSGLVGEYAGKTPHKTNQLIDSALDGVLFIDEAYALVDEKADDAYGREAIQTLLKRMEDDRDRLVVIVAGYPDEMDRMIRTNPGLSSRINTRLKFDDYAPPDLGHIFQSLCKRNQYQLPADARHCLLLVFDALYRERDRHFGNGRLARNIFEECVRALADRIAGISPLTEELLTTLTLNDIKVPQMDTERMRALLKVPHRLRSSCEKCGKRLDVAPDLLGRTVSCSICEERFRVEWADIER
ncbi:MAG: AAA family ATPase, partial [Planctomycetota bacterium]